MPRKARARRVGALLAATVLAGSFVACTPNTTDTIPTPHVADGELSADVTASFDAAVTQAMAATGSSAAIVGVWVPWAGSWVTAQGTNTPGGSAVTVDEVVKAGPITRMMTCDVLYALDDEGVVSIDDPVTRWTNAIGADSTVTLGQLCDSTSGYRSYAPLLLSRWLTNPTRVWNPHELAAYGVGQDPAVPAGEQFLASDTGYVVLGLALERATGETATDLFEKYVFEPLGMTSSALGTAGTAADQLSGLYSPNAEGGVNCTEPVDVSAWSTSAGYTADGATSTVADLGRYLRSVADGSRSFDGEDRFGSPLTVDNATTWFSYDGGAYQASTLVGQYGSVPGSVVAGFSDRDTGLTVVVVLNNSRANPASARNLAWELAAIASKAPAASGETAPATGYPWTAEQYGQQIVAEAICPIE